MPAAKARLPLTDKALRALRPPPSGRRIEIADGDVRNLLVRVSAGGQVSFSLMVRAERGGNPTRRGLGVYGTVTAEGAFTAGPLTLKQARVKARQWNSKFALGVDPREVERAAVAARRAEEQRGIKFEAVALEYLSARVIGPDEENPIARQWKETRRIVNVLITAWGSKAIAGITPDDVEDFIGARAEEAPAMARNTYATARALFNWASRRREYRPLGNPCLNLDAPEMFGPRPSRERALELDEIRIMAHVIRRLPYPFGPLYHLLALTGLRLREVANAEWREFDFEAGIWEIPASRMKGKRPHAVPLTPDISALLATLPRPKKARFLFTTTDTTPVSGFSKVKDRITQRMVRCLKAQARIRHDERPMTIPRWTTHDLRRTVRTQLSALPDVSHDTREAILAHVKPGVHGVYDRYDHFEEKRAALTAWGERLRSVLESPIGDLSRFVC